MNRKDSRRAPSVPELQRLVEQGPLENLFHRLSTPEDVAAAIVFLCLPASRQITAQTIHTSAGAVVQTAAPRGADLVRHALQRRLSIPASTGTMVPVT